MTENSVKTILLVEDDVGIRGFVAKALEGAMSVPLPGEEPKALYKVLTADDFWAAEDHLRAVKPDLVLTDFNYPGETPNKGALDTVRLLRDLYGDSVPCLLMSGSDALQADERAQFTNGDKFLQKPEEIGKSYILPLVSAYLDEPAALGSMPRPALPAPSHG